MTTDFRASTALAATEQGPTDEEIMGLFRVTLNTGIVEHCRAVLARWGRPAVEPVPVSERLPGPEDCDDQGRCWFGTAGSDTMKPHWVYRKAEHCRPWDTHWLLHWALPVPKEVSQ